MNPPASDVKWFPRPVDQNKPMKVAVLFDGAAGGGTASVKVLGGSDGGLFGQRLEEGEVGEIKKRSGGVISETDYAVRRGEA